MSFSLKSFTKEDQVLKLYIYLIIYNIIDKLK